MSLIALNIHHPVIPSSEAKFTIRNKSEELRTSAQYACIETSDSTPCPIQSMADEMLLHVFTFLDQKDLEKTPLVCKSFLRISDTHSLWEKLFEKMFPIVSLFSPGTTRFSPKYQFKIFTKFLENRTNEKLQDAYLKQLISLRGPTGSEGTVNQKRQVYKQTQANEKKIQLKLIVQSDEHNSELLENFNKAARQTRLARSAYLEEQRKLVNLVGTNYNGSEASILLQSKLGVINNDLKRGEKYPTWTISQVGFNNAIFAASIRKIVAQSSSQPTPLPYPPNNTTFVEANAPTTLNDVKKAFSEAVKTILNAFKQLRK